MQSQPIKKRQKEATADSGNWHKKLGPGLITGAADDDPSGIATYSQAGAQFGYHMLWTLCLTYPLMVGIQVVSARIGRVTGEGLAANIRQHYPRWLLYVIVSMLVIANTINIAADIAAMGDAVNLVIGGPEPLYVIGFGLLSLLLQVFIPYQRYVRVLKWLTLALFAYVGVAFSVDISWHQVALHLFVPQFTLNRDSITMIVAIFGTTISPYLFFWQASQEVEELHADPDAKPLRDAPRQARSQLQRIKVDTYIGMGVSNIVAFFIMLTTAATLFQHGITNIQTSAQAALALKPLAGEFAFLLFAAGIIGTGLLAIPVLAGSAAYAVAETFGWRKGLNLNLKMGRRFYAIIVLSTLIGVGLAIADTDPIKTLFWAAVINGVISVPIMVIMMQMGQNRAIQGGFAITRRLKMLGWAATAVMAVAVAGMFLTML